MTTPKHAALAANNTKKAIAEALRGTSLTNLLVGATRVKFSRGLSEMQADEKERLDAIFDTEIAPYYPPEAIEALRLSSQFLEPAEDVAVQNRETIFRFKVEGNDESEAFLAYEIVGDGVSYLGYLVPVAAYESHVVVDLMITKLFVGGRYALAVVVPAYGFADLYVFDEFEGRYFYTFSTPIDQQVAA